jgi:hypothetical protein
MDDVQDEKWYPRGLPGPVSKKVARGAACLLATLLSACGTAAGGAGGAGGDPAPAEDREGVFDFLVTSLNFYYPEPIGQSDQDAPNPCGLDGATDNTIYRPLLFSDAVVNGFDLDGVASVDDAGLCGQALSAHRAHAERRIARY